MDPKLREQISAYLDDELSPEEAREVLAWLEAHPEALKGVEESRRVWALLSAYPDEPVPEGFSDRVMSQVRSEEGAGIEPVTESRPALRVLRGGRRAAVAAAVLLALGAGAVIGRGFGRSPDAPPAATALESVPADLLDSDALTELATLTDEQFEAILTGEPSDLAGASGG